MNGTEQLALAWALADATADLMEQPQRMAICAAIGAGEYGTAIRNVLEFYAKCRMVLPRELLPDAETWIGGYTGTDMEVALRSLLGRIC